MLKSNQNSSYLLLKSEDEEKTIELEQKQKINQERNKKSLLKPRYRTLSGHSKGVTSVAISSDNRFIVSGSADKSVKIWDLESEQVIRTLSGHSKGVTSVAISSDNRFIVSGSWDFTVKIWDFESGQDIRTFKGHSRSVYSVAISSDNRFIVSGSSDNTVKIWNLESEQEIRTLNGHSRGVTSVFISSDNRFIVSGSFDHTVKIWDLESGQEIRTLKGHSNSVYSVAISSDNRFIVSGGYDKTVKIWDFENGQEIRTLNGHTNEVYSVAISSDNRFIVSGSGDKSVIIWDFECGKEIRTLNGHSDVVNSMVISSDNRFIVSGSKDFTVKIWDLEGQEIRTLNEHSNEVESVAISSDNRFIVSGSYDNTVKIWDFESGQAIRTLNGHSYWVYSVAISSDNRFIVSGSKDKTVKIWDFESGQEIRTLDSHANEVHTVVISSDDQFIVSGGYDKTVKIWDLECGQEIRTLNGHTEWVVSVAISSDNRFIISGGYDKSVKIWDFDSGEEIRTLNGHSKGVNSLAISSDNRFIVSGSWDSTVKIWDLESGQEIRTLNEHSNDVFSVVISSDNRFIISGSDDKSVKIWDLESEQEIRTLNGHSHAVFSVAISSDFTLFAIAIGNEIQYASFDDFVGSAQGTHLTPFWYFEFLLNVKNEKWEDRWSKMEKELDKNPGSLYFTTRFHEMVAKANEPKILDRLMQKCPPFSYDTILDCAAKTGSAECVEVVLTHLTNHIYRINEMQHDISSGGYSFANPCDENMTESLIRIGKKYKEQLRKFLETTPLMSSHRIVCKPTFKAHIGEDTMIIKPSEDRTPFNFWKEYEKEEDIIFCEGALLPFPGMAKITKIKEKEEKQKEESLLKYAVKTEDAKFFSGIILQTIVQHKWDAYGRSLFLQELSSFVIDLCFLISLTVLDSHNPLTLFPIILGMLLVVFVCVWALLYKIENKAFFHFIRFFNFVLVGGAVVLRTRQEEIQVVYTGSTLLFLIIQFLYLTRNTLIPRARKIANAILRLDIFNVLDVLDFFQFLAGVAVIVLFMVESTEIDYVLIFGLVFGVLRSVRHEWMQFKQPQEYFDDTWNILDTTQILLSIAICVTFFIKWEHMVLLLGVSVYLKWFGFLKYMQAFSETGALIRMIFQIFKDVRWFLLVLLISTTAVGNMFFSILRKEDCGDDMEEECSNGFGGIGETFFTMFNMLLLTEFEIDEFLIGPYQLLIQIAFFVSMVFVPIVLLNLMIALMGDSYERIQERSVIEFQLLRAGIIVEQELFFTEEEKENEKYFPTHLHAMVPRGKNVSKPEGQEWLGVLGSYRLEMQSMEENMNKKFGEIGHEFQGIQNKIEGKISEKIDKSESKLEARMIQEIQGIENKSEARVIQEIQGIESKLKKRIDAIEGKLEEIVIQVVQVVQGIENKLVTQPIVQVTQSEEKPDIGPTKTNWRSRKRL